ncbi:LuxR family maltose regulon positive regulatory protein [Thermosporothrix hazakensis]|jgi:LuxR family maltose regulon positive regulatory protein|uniref:LuxR family maltose regulon positive regulatory protein n=2 Tax=Thermosporothrix TaxID=768650 RepID=A0A326U2Z2_THEHA|nr:LuxR C-terminal-related transcriptional regulator [Thermosporothrix hazakensis]PZW25400.1 LuxR family maltose regulon positive regulatory protein [Thermosporothrix hazakensis]BBH90734.1 LuxR family transcriptional regulator [Thermosporothrix sp. COM3]GCE48784.1 LuxR family transcriptional regulator [Thermosporothrix hazakensis]
MAHATPLVLNHVLITHSDTPILLESVEWWRWLEDETHSTFRFRSARGSFTARRERKHGLWYWYAYRRAHGRLYKAYLGKTEELRAVHLEVIAQSLAAQILQSPQNRSSVREREELPPLLATKLYRPPMRPELVLRPRLLEQLDRGKHYPLTLITAPAGSGKTTLLSSWCEHRDGLSAWVSLDAEDNDPVLFWTYVQAALRRLCPALQEQTPWPSRSVLTTIVNSLATVSQDVFLILDDYHLVKSQGIHETFGFLLEHLPPQVHLIIASRSEVPLPLFRFRARGQLNEITASDLRFSRDEIAAFWTRLLHIELSTEEVAALDQQTEGWAVALQLAARQQGKTGQIPDAGSKSSLFAYFTGEVLEQQPEPIRTALLYTSILKRFTAALCDAVTGQQGGTELLAYLKQENLFLVPLDERGEWYRYHHLFAEFLYERLCHSFPEQVPDLHRRAAHWYELHGYLSEAVEHAFAAQDMELAATLIEREVLKVIARGEVVTLLHWCSRLSVPVFVQFPVLLLFYSGLLSSVGQMDQAERYFQLAEKAVERRKQDATLSEADALWLDGLYATSAAALAAYRGDVERAYHFVSQARANPLLNDYLRSVIAACLGVVYLFSGDAESAYSALEEAIRWGVAGQNLHASIASRGAQSFLLLTQGQLRRVAEMSRAAIEESKLISEYRIPSLSMQYFTLADVLYEWNRLEEAEQVLRAGLQLGSEWGYVGALGYGYSTLAFLRVTEGRFEEALALLQRVLSEVRAGNLHSFVTLTEAYQVRVYLRMEKLDAVAEWARTLPFSPDDALVYTHELTYLIQAEALLAISAYQQAEELLRRLLAIVEPAGHMRSAIQARTLLALLYQTRGQREEAIVTLARALQAAEPEGYKRVFVERGAKLIPLLQRVALQGVTPTYVQQLLSLFSEVQRNEGSLLSERELDVLRLIAAGKSNQEIAQAFVLTVSTVKSHLNNIYTKLGVHSRTQAIARAQELRLL